MKYKLPRVFITAKLGLNIRNSHLFIFLSFSSTFPLQRQGAFGSIFFKTKLGVTAANDAELTNMDNNISEIVSASLDVSKNSVMFEFKTPLSAGIRYEIHIIKSI